MKLTKLTIAKCLESGTIVYNAKKTSNKNGNFITCTYAVKINETTCTAQKIVSFEGETQHDIVSYFEQFAN